MTTEDLKLLTPAELAALLGITVKALYTLNYLGTGPPPIHIGRRVRYSRAAVSAWLRACSQAA